MTCNPDARAKPPARLLVIEAYQLLVEEGLCPW
jgi:hypothetical protein